MPKEKKSKRKRPRDEEPQQTSEYFDYEDDSNSAHGASSKDDFTSAVPTAAGVDIEAKEEEEAEEDAYGAKDFRSQVMMRPVQIQFLFVSDYIFDCFCNLASNFNCKEEKAFKFVSQLSA